MANKLKRSELHSYNCDRCEWVGSISGLIRLDTAHCPGCGYDGTLERQSNTNRITRAADVLKSIQPLIQDYESVMAQYLESPFKYIEELNKSVSALAEKSKEINRVIAILEGRE